MMFKRCMPGLLWDRVRKPDNRLLVAFSVLWMGLTRRFSWLSSSSLPDLA